MKIQGLILTTVLLCSLGSTGCHHTPREIADAFKPTSIMRRLGISRKPKNTTRRKVDRIIKRTPGLTWKQIEAAAESNRLQPSGGDR
ncbi:MAG: hypothetical protein QGG42_12415 [Phycisphaerae bacterium]|nr:hypothetical protein [Phycisphaerae bacterium]